MRKAIQFDDLYRRTRRILDLSYERFHSVQNGSGSSDAVNSFLAHGDAAGSRSFVCRGLRLIRKDVDAMLTRCADSVEGIGVHGAGMKEMNTHLKEAVHAFNERIEELRGTLAPEAEKDAKAGNPETEKAAENEAPEAETEVKQEP
jgi:hypothetical protein